MSNSTHLGIGLVGLGIGQTHLEGYRGRGIEVAAICDVDEERLRRSAERFGVRTVYTDVYAMIADPNIGVIDLAIQPWHRWPVVAAAAKAGKHRSSRNRSR